MVPFNPAQLVILRPSFFATHLVQQRQPPTANLPSVEIFVLTPSAQQSDHCRPLCSGVLFNIYQNYNNDEYSKINIEIDKLDSI